jgi:hypothetical protein
VLGLAVFGVASQALGQVTTIGAHPRQKFPVHIPRPIKIEMGFYLVDFARINGREETFDIQGYLTASWTDPTLARKPDEPKAERRFPPETLWTPNFEFINAAEQVKIQNEAALIVDDDGRITQRFRFVGKFSWPMDLRRFPFDAQALQIHIEPFEREVKDVQFVVNREHIGRLRSAFLSDWIIPGDTLRADRAGAPNNPPTKDQAAAERARQGIKPVDAKQGLDAWVEDVRYQAFDRTNSRLVVQIQIIRKSTFYLWRVLLPLTLLVVTSLVIYRFDPSNLQPPISTTVAILLNVILFNFTIDFALPKVSYPTFIDTYAVTCFLTLVINMHLVTRVHIVFQRDGMDAARLLQRRVMRILPIGFVAAVCAEAIHFLG